MAVDEFCSVILMQSFCAWVMPLESDLEMNFDANLLTFLLKALVSSLSQQIRLLVPKTSVCDDS